MLLLLKLVLVPALVAAVTLASRHWGLRVAGILTGLPLVAGPTFAFLAVEQGPAFAANAARAALLGLIATTAFCVAYGRAAARLPWMASVIVGWVAFLAPALILARMPDQGGPTELAFALVALMAGRRLLPAPNVATAAAPPRGDLAIRLIAAAGAVVVFTGLAAVLGPRMSGVLSVFPVVTAILAVFTHIQQGPAPVATFLRGLLRGMDGLAVFCIVFSVALDAFAAPLAGAIAAALAAQTAMQSVMLWRARS